MMLLCSLPDSDRLLALVNDRHPVPNLYQTPFTCCIISPWCRVSIMKQNNELHQYFDSVQPSMSYQETHHFHFLFLNWHFVH